jgi:KaiC/GvpD/RAD55 family RecA-like ATPase
MDTTASVSSHTVLVGQGGDRVCPNPFDHARVVIRPASAFEHRPIEWLDPGRIALGKLTLLAGDPGLGKSFLTLDLAARVSRGDLPEERPPGHALILSAEDDPNDTIRPRLEAMGADLSRVHVVEGVVAPQGRVCRPARLDDDMKVLAHAARQIEDLRLIVIDPISAYLGSTDSHNNAEVRAVLAELARLARWTGAAVVCVTHLNKSQGNQSKAVYRAMGSLAFTAAARTVFAVSKHPDHPDKRVVSTVKSNIAKPTDGRVFEVRDGVFRWLEERCRLDADAIEGGPETVDQVSALEEAEAFLAELLRDGPVQAVDGIFQASALGLSERTLTRARRRLGVVATRPTPGGAWVWALPGQSPAAARPRIAPDEGEDDLYGTV